MKKKLKQKDVEECLFKIQKILSEYNCEIVFDEELNDTIIVDKDSLQFVSAKQYMMIEYEGERKWE